MAISRKQVEKVEEKPVEVKKSGCFVCEGKSITSKKGILKAGDEVKAEYFAGGQKDLDALIKLGCVK